MIILPSEQSVKQKLSIRKMWKNLLFLSVVLNALLGSIEARSFDIDYDGNSFRMDGQPFRYISGSIHYFRLPRELWRNRLQKMRAAGLNAISTYVEWSQHEKIQGIYDFNGDLDLVEFIRIAEQEGLFVILRPGPYICAERDMGGLPYWLLKENPNIKLRTNDPIYTKYIKKWFDVLMPIVQPLLYGNGGPIIMVQVENEYGSYSPIDNDYKIWLRDLIRSYVNDKNGTAVLFTTDGNSKSNVEKGKIEDVYATVDFGPGSNVTSSFEAQRAFEPKGPLVNSEFYPGWLTHWGEPMAKRDTSSVIKTLREILSAGANVNFYMFYGGTNFGFTAGANYGSYYQSDITSYDYDAPITEAGDLTPKYHAIVDVIKEYMELPNNYNFTDIAPRGAYGTITLNAVTSLISPYAKTALGKTSQNTYPVIFETLNQNFGYLLYETQMSSGVVNQDLKFSTSDLGHVFVNGIKVGEISREQKTDHIAVTLQKGDTMGILVENLGRINFGIYNNDTKGILSNVTIGNTPILNWQLTSMELDQITPAYECSPNSVEQCFSSKNDSFRFYFTNFTIENPIYDGDLLGDTFINVKHLSKGLVFLNGKNLGRYWSTRGPQYSLYVPGVFLKAPPEQNQVVVLDEASTSDTITISFEALPVTDGKIRVIRETRMQEIYQV